MHSPPPALQQVTWIALGVWVISSLSSVLGLKSTVEMVQFGKFGHHHFWPVMLTAVACYFQSSLLADKMLAGD
jgi:hypothetical protein